jgi:hypothetical protein
MLAARKGFAFLRRAALLGGGTGGKTLVECFPVDLKPHTLSERWMKRSAFRELPQKKVTEGGCDQPPAW